MSISFRLFLSLSVALSTTALAHSQTDVPRLFRSPTISKTQIAFAFAGDLWTVDRAGGEAHRLTTGVGIEAVPIFSPDGSQIAFTGQYDGNTDVYVIPASGGIPERLTYHPGTDLVRGWSRDGKRILFTSGRESGVPEICLYTISRDGGTPERLPFPSGTYGSYSPDGTKIAYVPRQPQQAWKRYRGGETMPVWIGDIATSKVVKVPRENSNDSFPMWIVDTVYFLSDRNGPVTLFSYDTESQKVKQVLPNTGFDIKSATANGDTIVYEQFGSIHLYDVKSGTEHPVNISLTGDLPEVRPYYRNVSERVANFSLSPTGKRAVFEARGELFTKPIEKGDTRNITNTSGSMERDPAWSPDGTTIAYFSDEGGEYALHLKNQKGTKPARVIKLAETPSFFYTPRWSPDSKKIAYTDKHLNFWYVDVEKGTPVKIDTDLYETPFRPETANWSPDSQWLTYAHELPTHYHAICVYSLATGKSTQITDGMSDAQFPVFDASGKYLYFTASTDAGPTTGWLDLSSVNHPITRSAYMIVLRNNLPSPLAPESDEEKEEKASTPSPPEAPQPEPAKTAEAPDAKKPDPKAVTIDFEGISQRILSLPAPVGNHEGLVAGKAGVLFIYEGNPVYAPITGNFESGILHRFDLEKRRTDPFATGVTGFSIAANGEKLLLLQGARASVVATAAPPPPGSGTLSLSGMVAQVDPKAEWAQMYHEVWRIERDFLYDPNLHGLNVHEYEARYAKFLPGIASRADLNYLFTEMLGEITIGHMFVNGGDMPSALSVGVGLLGADFALENGHYRFKRVYNGENWNPNLRAPLTEPGVNVKAGDYLLAVNGRPVTTDKEVYAFFEVTSGRQTVLKVGPNPNGEGAREVTVVPFGNDSALRHRAWIDDNRRLVDKLSNGKLAYVYVPDTAQEGYTDFNRYYFAQIDKAGAIIDERYNGGGFIADYIIDYLRRPLMATFTQRDGQDMSVPVGSIYGPKVMLINEQAGSGGDALPWMFRHAKIGPLVGTRTWGGLVGIFGYPELMDGGSVTAPRTAFWTPEGKWDVENHGVAPDIEVENDPASVRAGHDPQLERAVAVALDLLAKHPAPKLKRPAYPNYHPAKK